MKKITLWLFALLTSWQIHSQISINEGFEATTTPAGWTYSSFSRTTTNPCIGTASVRRNFWSSGTTGSVTTPNYVAVSNGEQVDVSFDWKTIEYSAGDGIGISLDVQYSLDNGVTWSTFGNVISNAITACATWTGSIPVGMIPSGSDFRMRFNGTYISGDFYFYIDNVQVLQQTFIPPNCTSIVSPSDGATNITSGLITWQSSTGAPTGYKLNVGTSAGATDVLNGADVGNVTSYNIGTLTGSTTYYVTIIPYNANGDATGCTETSFSSCFINVAPWTYDVETAAATTNSTIADCWSSNPTGTTSAFRWDVDADGGTPTGTSTGPSAANSGVKYFYTEASSGSTGSVAELYTPLVDLSGLAEPTLQFYYHMHGVNMGALHVDVFDGTTWTNDVLVISGPQQTAASDPWTLSVISLNAFASNTVQVRFRGVRGNGTAGDMSLDDISFEEAPSCFDPINLGATNITSDGFDLLFTDASGGNQFDFAYVVQPQGTGAPATYPAGTPEDGSNQINATDFSIPVSGLTPNTSYEIYVAADCNGNWVGPINFKTLCTAFDTFPFVETFNVDSTTKPCWTVIDANGDNDAWNLNGTYIPRSGQSAQLYTDYNTSNNDYLISPQLDLGTTAKRLKFWVRHNSNFEPDNLNVRISTTGNDIASFASNLLLTITTTQMTNVYTEYIVDLSAYSGLVYIAFAREDAPADGWYVAIDDVTVEDIPTTAPSCATNIVATPDVSCGNFANQITWDVVSGADGYYITIGTTMGGNDVADAVDLINPTYSFLGTANTTYYYTVVPYNSFNSATGCVEQSFTTAATGCYCSPSSTSSSTYVDNFTTTGGSQNISNLSTGFTTGGYLDSSAQFVESFATSSFDFNAAIVGGTAGFSIWVDWNNDLNFDNATEKVFNTTAYGSGPFTGTITIPAGTPIGNYRMRITTDWNSSNPSNPCTAASRAEFEDYTITVIAPPSCVAPSGLNVTSVSASSANLGWIENGTASSWDVEWGTLGFTPTGTPTISGASNPEIISGLSPNTAYSFYVRANCGVDGFSGWSGPFNFTTSCIAEDVPYSQNFESATIPNLPTCTSQQNVGSGNLWAVVNNPGYGFTTNALRYSWNTSNAANVWFFTNGVNLVGGTTYKISYDYGSASSFYVESLRVSYGSSATAVGMTDLLAEHPTVNNNVTPINNEIEFTPATSGVYYFGFNAYSIANQFNLYVDNILVDVALSSNTFDNNNFTAYPNPVKDILNLTYTSEITSVRVINMLGQEVIARSLNATNAQVDMSQLSAGTYIVNVTIGDTVKTIKVVKQ